MGGGRRHYLPESEGGVRDDGRNLLEEATALGYQVATDWSETFTADLPLLALIDNNSLAFEIDRLPDEPSLADLTRRALELLSATDEGFFLMIEAARIDHAAHDNDAAGTLHDVLAYDEALAVALEFIEDGNTLLVAVADHETGGMSLGRQGVYDWYPSVLSRVRSSHGPMVQAVQNGNSITDVMRDYAGISDLSDEEYAVLEVALEENRIRRAIGQVIAQRAAIAWTTGGHTAVDVKLYAKGPGRDRFIGNHDNTYIAHMIADLLNLDLDAVTERLQSQELVGAALDD